MVSHWSDEAARGLDPLDLLVYASRLVGSETSLAVWGGGNTSIKLTEPDLQGRPVPVLRVKGSGSDLKSVTRKDFPGVRLDDVRPLLGREEMGDQEMVDYLARCLQEPGSPRPSIETLLHGFLPFEGVIHTHADAIVALTNTEEGHALVGELFGKEAVGIAYRRPGFRLSCEVAGAVRTHPEARGVVLEKHGLITWGATLKEAYLGTIDLVSRAEERLREAARGRRVFGPPTVATPDAGRRRAVAAAVAPVLRGLIGRDRLVILRFDDGEDVRELVSAPEAPALTRIGPATPDHTIYSKRLPCFVPLADPASPEAVVAALRPAVEAFVRDYTAYFEAHRFDGATLVDPYPRVILLPGLGMFTSGKDARAAAIVADIYHHTAWVLRAASGVGRYVSLTPAEAFGVEYWPLELYKLTLAPPEKDLARRVALVTGAAGGIGRAVARRLAREGAHVVAADVDGAGAARVAAEIVKEAGPARALGVAMDVTSETAVQAGIRAAVEAYGGLDVVVSNAGIAHSSPLDAMALADWERSFAVNATGHFLVTREALRVLKAQGLGGSLVFVATKNVMAPGKDFAAYSAAKAAEAQLAKVAAIEGGPHGVRANIVNPDAVFRDSGLWSEEVRRERARAQGIALDQLEEFYRKRNLLGVSVLPEDVAEAVLFLASDRSAKTTGCTLTVDGGVRDAFPR
ncbi:MAG: bifunctional rhamnulose-1-phosphate aldolase/short-chain dehydrogenase [Candidatus Rokubacteria bacterium]|nr:bifunctional rhamnulose-1-phosphate aldolase/short-chain dehydrogenase [Candidatus Rokubacteria bacterium]